MALLELGPAEAEKLVGEYPDITVAVYAAPQQTVIAGPPDQVDAAIAVVDGQGKLARRVEVDVASHHPTVDPILADLKDALADLKPMTPKIPLISTVGQAGDAAPKFDADYWVVNLRNPVRFSQAVTKAAETHSTFVEVSPHPLLSHAINGTLESAKPRGAQVSGTLTRDNPETLTFHTQLATIRPPSVAAAQNVHGTKKLIDLPPTPWQHVRYWAAPFSAPRQAAASTRCWARTSNCHPDATTSSPPMSAPNSSPTCSTTRCTARQSCRAPVSAKSPWPPRAKPSACRRSR